MPAKIYLSNEERLRRYKYSEKKRSYKYHHTEKGRLAKQRANRKKKKSSYTTCTCFIKSDINHLPNGK